MSALIPILTILEVIVCLLLILVVMMQRPRQEGLGAAFGEGMTSQMWGAQTTNVLQKGTVWLAMTLFVLTLGLAALVSRDHKQKADTSKLVDKSAAPAAAPAPAGTPSPAAAGTPAAATVPAEAPAKPAETKPAAETPAKPAEAPKAAPSADKPAAEASKPAAPKLTEPTAPAPAPAPAPAGTPK